jgi:hypothetical protein
MSARMACSALPGLLAVPEGADPSPEPGHSGLARHVVAPRVGSVEGRVGPVRLWAASPQDGAVRAVDVGQGTCAVVPYPGARSWSNAHDRHGPVVVTP